MDAKILDCKHVFNYYWGRGKCKGSKCILCGYIDKKLKPEIKYEK